jgi:predicted ribosomally synthesized six-cysteine peptide SCIFF
LSIFIFPRFILCAIICPVNLSMEVRRMKHVKTINGSTLKDSLKKGGCGECQTSCQSACKTSCTVANQSCEKN